MIERTKPALVGVLPLGALGAAFYQHLSGGPGGGEGRVRLVGRRGSSFAAAVEGHGSVRLAAGDGERLIPTAECHYADLLAAHADGWLPEVVLVVPQPDGLLDVLGDAVALLERMTAEAGLEAAVEAWPVFVLSSNGIYHERVRRYLVELLEDAMLFGRLPDLWGGAMESLVGKLVRGVTIQTGLREGSGVNALYRPGPPGLTTLAGGRSDQRRLAAAVLGGLGGRFPASGEPPVRVEFNKALVNLWGNLLGQIRSIDDSGRFTPLRVGQIIGDVDAPHLRELSGHLFAIGRAVRAYAPDDDFDALHRRAFEITQANAHHVPSSVQLLGSQIAAGRLRAELTPTEKWLLEPLVRYARAAGLSEAEAYFVGLQDELLRQLERAVAAQ